MQSADCRRQPTPADKPYRGPLPIVKFFVIFLYYSPALVKLSIIFLTKELIRSCFCVFFELVCAKVYDITVFAKLASQVWYSAFKVKFTFLQTA
jgi:hypothetical protein